MLQHRPLPPTRYDDEGNMINYWRKDGMRPFLFSDSMENFNEEKVRNYLQMFSRRDEYVDFVITFKPHTDFEKCARSLYIPALVQEADGPNSEYGRIAIQVEHSGVTNVALFYSAGDYPNQDKYSMHFFADYFREKNIRVEWIEW